MSEGPTPLSRDRRTCALLVGGLALAVALLVVSGRTSIHDERAYLASSAAMARAILGKPGTAVADALGHWSPGPGLVLLPAALPMVALAPDGELGGAGIAVVYVIPPVLLALAAIATFLLLVRLGRSLRGAALAALAGTIGSVALAYAQLAMSETVLIALLALGALAAHGERTSIGARAGWKTGLATGGILLMKLVYLPAAIALGLYAVGRAGARRRALWLILGSLPGLAIYAGFNQLRSGQALDFAYPSHPDVAFDTPLPVGVYSLLFSSGKGLVWYSPIVVLAVAGLGRFLGRHRAEAWLVVALPWSTLLTLATYRYWSGDWSWGPRYIVPLVPLLCLPVVSWFEEMNRSTARRLLTGGVIAAAVLVNLLAVSFETGRYYKLVFADCWERFPRAGSVEATGEFRGHDLTHVHYIPDFSPLRGHGWMLLDHFGVRQSPPWRRLGLCGPDVGLAPQPGPLAPWWSWMPIARPSSRILVWPMVSLLVAAVAVLLRRLQRITAEDA